MEKKTEMKMNGETILPGFQTRYLLKEEIQGDTQELNGVIKKAHVAEKISPQIAHKSPVRNQSSVFLPISELENRDDSVTPRGCIMISSPTVWSAFNTLPISAVSLPRSNSERKRGLRLPSPEIVSRVKCRFFLWTRAMLPNSAADRTIPYSGFCFFIVLSKMLPYVTI